MDEFLLIAVVALAASNAATAFFGLWKSSSLETLLRKLIVERSVAPQQLVLLDGRYTLLPGLERPLADLDLDPASVAASTPEAADNSLLEEATEVFGSAAKASVWMERPTSALLGLPPRVVWRSIEGRQAVRDLLVRISYGIAA